MRGRDLSHVALGGPHHLPAALHGRGVGEDHGVEGATGHVGHQPPVEEFSWGENR